MELITGEGTGTRTEFHHKLWWHWVTGSLPTRSGNVIRGISFKHDTLSSQSLELLNIFLKMLFPELDREGFVFGMSES